MIQAKYPLSGTMTFPDEIDAKFPAVVIISGTGKADRDGNMKKMRMNIYNDIAEFLTVHGFITLRYDKRGTHKSEGDYLSTGVNDIIEDAAACVDFLQKHPKVDNENILILGHSEGAIIAPAVHKRTPVSGLILLAGAAEPSKDLLPRQSERAYAEMNQAKGLKGWFFRTLKVTKKARKQNEKIFKKIAASNKDVMRIQGVKINAKWLRETLTYNVLDYLKEVDCPVLAITGEKDLQVPPEQVKRVPEVVKGDAEWHIIPDMNHILRKYDGQHTMLGLLKEYKTQLNQPIDSELLDIMSRWLQRFQK